MEFPSHPLVYSHESSCSDIDSTSSQESLAFSDSDSSLEDRNCTQSRENRKFVCTEEAHRRKLEDGSAFHVLKRGNVCRLPIDDLVYKSLHEMKLWRSPHFRLNAACRLLDAYRCAILSKTTLGPEAERAWSDHCQQCLHKAFEYLLDAYEVDPEKTVRKLRKVLRSGDKFVWSGLRTLLTDHVVTLFKKQERYADVFRLSHDIYDSPFFLVKKVMANMLEWRSSQMPVLIEQIFNFVIQLPPEEYYADGPGIYRDTIDFIIEARQPCLPRCATAHYAFTVLCLLGRGCAASHGRYLPVFTYSQLLSDLRKMVQGGHPEAHRVLEWYQAVREGDVATAEDYPWNAHYVPPALLKKLMAGRASVVCDPVVRDNGCYSIELIEISNDDPDYSSQDLKRHIHKLVESACNGSRAARQFFEDLSAGHYDQHRHIQPIRESIRDVVCLMTDSFITAEESWDYDLVCAYFISGGKFSKAVWRRFEAYCTGLRVDALDYEERIRRLTAIALLWPADLYYGSTYKFREQLLSGLVPTRESLKHEPSCVKYLRAILVLTNRAWIKVGDFVRDCTPGEEAAKRLSTIPQALNELRKLAGSQYPGAQDALDWYAAFRVDDRKARTQFDLDAAYISPLQIRDMHNMIVELSFPETVMNEVDIIVYRINQCRDRLYEEVEEYEKKWDKLLEQARNASTYASCAPQKFVFRLIDDPFWETIEDFKVALAKYIPQQTMTEVGICLDAMNQCRNKLHDETADYKNNWFKLYKICLDGMNQNPDKVHKEFPGYEALWIKLFELCLKEMHQRQDKMDEKLPEYKALWGKLFTICLDVEHQSRDKVHKGFADYETLWVKLFEYAQEKSMYARYIARKIVFKFIAARPHFSLLQMKLHDQPFWQTSEKFAHALDKFWKVNEDNPVHFAEVCNEVFLDIWCEPFSKYFFQVMERGTEAQKNSFAVWLGWQCIGMPVDEYHLSTIRMRIMGLELLSMDETHVKSQIYLAFLTLLNRVPLPAKLKGLVYDCDLQLLEKPSVKKPNALALLKKYAQDGRQDARDFLAWAASSGLDYFKSTDLSFLAGEEHKDYMPYYIETTSA